MQALYEMFFCSSFGTPADFQLTPGWLKSPTSGRVANTASFSKVMYGPWLSYKSTFGSPQAQEKDTYATATGRITGHSWALSEP